MPLIGENTLKRLNRQLRRAEQGEFDRPPLRKRKHVPKNARPRVVMLLDDCPSGQRVECAILVEIESTETQIVEICGTPKSGTFKLDFDGQTTQAMPYNVTAEAMQEFLEALSNLNPGDVIVEIGPTPTRSLYRWLISFTGQYEGDDVPELVPRSVEIIGEGDVSDVDLEVEVRSKPDLEDTGETLDALCVVPLPEAVILPAGAVAVAIPIDSFGYTINITECRDCVSPEAEASY